MKIGLNAHPQAFGNVARDIAMLVRLKPTFVRVSAFQFGVINQERATRAKRMVDAGLKVVGLCTSETCAKMDDPAWVRYCIQYKNLSKWAGVMYDQIGNEWNIQPFWGGPPDARKAYKRFKTAQGIICRPCIAAGVTCENKSASNKISATSFISSWLADGADPLAWDFHYYATDARQRYVYDDCKKILNGKRMVFLETGDANPAGHVAWYNKVKTGLWTAPPEHVCWYTYNAHAGFELVDKNSNPGQLAKLILGGKI